MAGDIVNFLAMVLHFGPASRLDKVPSLDSVREGEIPEFAENPGVNTRVQNLSARKLPRVRSLG